MAVHAGPEAGGTVEDALPSLCFGLSHVPVAAHRLDQDTSGCLALARHPKARSRLGRLFERGEIEKIYWAIVAGQPTEEAGIIALPLRKQNDKAGWRIVVDPLRGRDAVTSWRVLGLSPGHCWLELRPKTGRTHQLRVHLAAQGWPILGDPFYGAGLHDTPMQLLARRLAIPYWADRPPVTAQAEPPQAMRDLLCRSGWGG
jgi:tRNA pseudouridine32 synthase / 23S rRNA pseudouridine746 synthase